MSLSCVIIITILFLFTLRIAFITSIFVALSSEAVGSSKIMIDAFDSKTRAIPIRFFSPSENDIKNFTPHQHAPQQTFLSPSPLVPDYLN